MLARRRERLDGGLDLSNSSPMVTLSVVGLPPSTSGVSMELKAEESEKGNGSFCSSSRSERLLYCSAMVVIGAKVLLLSSLLVD